MNWKIVATLIVGALFVGACASQTQSPSAPATAPESGTRAPQDEGASAPAAGDPTVAPVAPPGAAPAAPAAAKNPTDAKKGVVMHE